MRSLEKWVPLKTGIIWFRDGTVELGPFGIPPSESYIHEDEVKRLLSEERKLADAEIASLKAEVEAEKEKYQKLLATRTSERMALWSGQYAEQIARLQAELDKWKRVAGEAFELAKFYRDQGITKENLDETEARYLVFMNRMRELGIGEGKDE